MTADTTSGALTTIVLGPTDRAVPFLFAQEWRAAKVLLDGNGRIRTQGMSSRAHASELRDFTLIGKIVILPGELTVDERSFLSLPEVRRRMESGHTSVINFRTMKEGSELDAALISLMSSAGNRDLAEQVSRHDNRVGYVRDRVDREKKALGLGDEATKLEARSSLSDKRLDHTGQPEQFSRFRVRAHAAPGPVASATVEMLKRLEKLAPPEGDPKRWPGTRSGAVIDVENTGDHVIVLPAGAESSALEAYLAPLSSSTVEVRWRCGRPVLTGRFKADSPEHDALAKEIAYGGTKVAAIDVRLFLPFQYKKAIDPENPGPGLDAEAIERCKDYFHGHLHALLGLSAVSLRAADGRKGDFFGLASSRRFHGRHAEPSFELRHPSYGEDSPLTARLRAWRLHYLGGSDVCLIEAEVTIDASVLSQVLDTIAEVRVVNRIFKAKAMNAKGVMEEYRGVWQSGMSLLEHLTKATGLTDARYLGDDRAFVFQSLVLAGDPPLPGGEGARMAEVTLARMMTVDGYGTNFFYRPEFSKRELAQGRLDRFEGSDFVATDHSFGFRGYVGFKADSFARDEIHALHMPALYRVMVIYALLVAAKLEDLDRRLDAAGKDPDQVLGIRDDFTTFLARNWRPELSSQVQGRELFDRIRSQLRLDARIAGLDARMRRAETLASENRQKREAELEEAAAIRGESQSFVLSIIGVLLALYSLNTDILPEMPRWLEQIAGKPLVALLFVTAVGIGVMGLIRAFVWFWRGRRWPARLAATIIVVLLFSWFVQVSLAGPDRDPGMGIEPPTTPQVPPPG